LGPSLARFGGSRSILRIAPSRCRQARSAVAAVSSCSGACIEILVRSVRARSGIPTIDPTVFGLTGDLRLDAFAGRLVSYGGAADEIEALASFALNKPARDWSDRDPDRAALELAELALRFRQAEGLLRATG